MMRIAIYAVVMAGTAIALAPVAWALGALWWLVAAVVGSAIGLFGALRGAGGPSPPRSAAGLLGAAGISGFPMAVVGVLVFLGYGVGLGLGYAVEMLWGLFGPRPELAGPVAAVLAVAVLLLVGTPMMVTASMHNVGWLTVPAARRLEAYRYLWTERRRQNLASWALGGFLVVVATVFAVRSAPSWVCGVLVQAGLVFAATPAWQLVEIERRLSRSHGAREAVGSLLETLGFKVDAAPRQEADDDADPLLTKLDLVARRDDTVLAVEIKTSAQEGRRIDWTAAASLGLAASAVATGDGDRRPDARPLLVLVDADADPSLERAIEVEGVSLVQFTAEELASVSAADSEQRRALAERLMSSVAATDALEAG
jgi:hypothetical protein